MNSNFYTFQSHQNISENYKFIHQLADGLQAYAQFTGKQFLIINHDPFDWIDVIVTVNATKGTTPVMVEVESVNSDETIFAVPRIKAGENFTLQANQLTTPASPLTQALAAQVYSLRIWGTTPRGQGSWDGRWNNSPVGPPEALPMTPFGRSIEADEIPGGRAGNSRPLLQDLRPRVRAVISRLSLR